MVPFMLFYDCQNEYDWSFSLSFCLQNNIPWHCFSFDRNGQNSALGDISIISRSSRPQSPALGKTVVTLCIPGRSAKDSGISEMEVRVWCRPPDKRIDRGKFELPPSNIKKIISYLTQRVSVTLMFLIIVSVFNVCVLSWNILQVLLFLFGQLYILHVWTLKKLSIVSHVFTCKWLILNLYVYQIHMYIQVNYTML